jgi:hypothetical protein
MQGSGISRLGGFEYHFMEYIGLESAWGYGLYSEYQIVQDLGGENWPGIR